MSGIALMPDADPGDIGAWAGRLAAGYCCQPEHLAYFGGCVVGAALAARGTGVIRGLAVTMVCGYAAMYGARAYRWLETLAESADAAGTV